METQGKLNVEFPDLELLQRFDVPGRDTLLIPLRTDLQRNSAPKILRKSLMREGPVKIRQIYPCMFTFLSVRMSASSAAATKKSRKITVDPKSIWKF